MTAAGYHDASVPPATTAPAADRSPPRNFLAAAEQRKLFWRFMPPAIVLVVVIELLTRQDGPPPPPREPQVDTRLEAVTGPPPVEDEVVILPPDEPAAFPDETLLAASPKALAKVRDATFFRQADRDAWLEAFLTLTGEDGRRLAPPQNVGFTELFGQPESFRGRAVRLRGTLRRLERLQSPRNDYGFDEYWQGWLEPAGGPASPVIIHALELPAGMATGMEIDEPVVVAGAFLKNMAYRAGDGVRVAPLILTRSPDRPPPAVENPTDRFWDISLGAVGVVTMLAIVAAIGVAFLVSGRGRRSAPAASDLDASLADVEPVSIDESLRRVAAEDRQRDDRGDQQET